MALDFYDINDKHFKLRLFEIQIRDLEDIKEALLELKRVSGVTIDPYGDTRIYSDHVKIITSFIEKTMDGVNPKNNKLKNTLNQIHSNLSSVQEGFLIIGD